MPACNFKWALHANYMHAWTVDTRPFSPIFRMGLGTKQVLAGLWYWAMSTLPTSPHNPLYVLLRWYWMPQSHTWQPLSTWTKEQAGNSNSPQVFHSLSQHTDEACSLSNRTCHCLWCTQPSYHQYGWQSVLHVGYVWSLDLCCLRTDTPTCHADTSLEVA